MVKSCSNCQFYQPLNKYDGSCRSRPPVIIAEAGTVVQRHHTNFPTVIADMWCGEFLGVEEQKVPDEKSQKNASEKSQKVPDEKSQKVPDEKSLTPPPPPPPA